MMGKYLRQLAMSEIQKGHLRPGPALLLLVVADRVRDDIGQLYAGEREVASWIGRPQSTMRKWRAPLVDAGHWKRLGVPRPGVAIKWQIFPENPEPNTGGYQSEGMPDDALQRIEAARNEHRHEQDRAQASAIEPQENLNPSSTEEKMTKGDVVSSRLNDDTIPIEDRQRAARDALRKLEAS